MLVVLVLAILAGIALPSYQEHVRQARRAEVAGFLLENAHRLERPYVPPGGYVAGPVPQPALPRPPSGTPLYILHAALSAESFTLTATAVPGGLMAGDPCASYSLDQINQRTPADSRCWRR